MRTVSIFKTAITAPSVCPGTWILMASASWRSSGKGTASFCVPSGRHGARSRSWTGPIRTLWRSVRMWSAMKDALSHEETPMLDTNICSFIMREQPAAVLKRPEQAVLRGDRIVVSAVTYAEMRFGATGPKASPRHIQLVDAFCARLDAVLPRDRAAVDATTDIRVALRLTGRRSARMTRPLPGTPSRRAPSR